MEFRRLNARFFCCFYLMYAIFVSGVEARAEGAGEQGFGFGRVAMHRDSRAEFGSMPRRFFEPVVFNPRPIVDCPIAAMGTKQFFLRDVDSNNKRLMRATGTNNEWLAMVWKPNVFGSLSSCKKFNINCCPNIPRGGATAIFADECKSPIHDLLGFSGRIHPMIFGAVGENIRPQFRSGMPLGLFNSFIGSFGPFGSSDGGFGRENYGHQQQESLNASDPILVVKIFRLLASRVRHSGLSTQIGVVAIFGAGTGLLLNWGSEYFLLGNSRCRRSYGALLLLLSACWYFGGIWFGLLVGSS